MNAINRTLYIPLYGKACVSRRGIILHDPTAERIWQKEGFPLRGKARSKWLAYYMSMRAAVIDEWVRAQMGEKDIALHLGCGLDARCERVKKNGLWYDVDLPDVMEIRKQYFKQTEQYHMIGADLLSEGWLEALPHVRKAVVVMEGVSMYLPEETISRLFCRLAERFERVELIMDAYTQRAVKLSRYGNPIRTVGASAMTGIDDPHQLKGLVFDRRLSLTPEEKICELKGMEQSIFRKLYAGGFAEGLYRLYTFHS